MPPLNGIDRGINGEMLKALEETGHSAQIAIVDASYDIPLEAQVVNYQGKTTAQALGGILKLVPSEHPVVTVMLPDDESFSPATEEMLDALESSETGLQPQLITRHGGSSERNDWVRRGFYSVANDPEKHTLFVRTRDEKAYACALFVVGHSQS